MGPTKVEVMSLLDDYARLPKPTGAVALSAAYLRALDRWEALPEQAEGVDKSWVLRADRAARATAERARLLT